MGTSVRVARVDIFYLVLLLYVDHILKVRCISENIYHVQSILVLPYNSIRAAAACWCAGLN